MKRIGPFELAVKQGTTPYAWLIRSIIFQQLHAKAAATIHGRLKDLFGGRDPKPEQLLEADEARLATAGLSRQKLAALKDLALAAKEKRVPTRARMKRMTDEEIINSLTPIRGVGRWTVEMLLIFGLGRTDVLAVDDFAIRKAIMILYGMKETPSRRELIEIGKRWSPYRTIASWYLWRSLD